VQSDLAQQDIARPFAACEAVTLAQSTPLATNEPEGVRCATGVGAQQQKFIS